MQKFKRYALMTAVVLASMAIGVLFHKYKFFPYSQMRHALSVVKRARSAANDPAVVLAGQYSEDSGEPELTKTIDSGLLPLSIRGVRLSEHFRFPKIAGGITVVDDKVVIIDRLGRLYAFSHGNLTALTFPPLQNNIEAFIRTSPSGTPILRVHDIEYSKDAAVLAVAYEYFDTSARAPRLVVATIGLNEKTLAPTSEWIPVFQGTLVRAEEYKPLTAGGRIASLTRDKLLVAIGDYNQDGVMLASAQVAQDPTTLFGKIVEIDLASKSHSVVTMGHRNPQGLTILDDGTVLATEHGPAGGDELNKMLRGANYGWPVVTYGTDYGTYDWQPSGHVGRHEGYESPLFAWLPSIGVSNLIQVKNFDPRWNGDLLVGSLKAMSLFRLRLERGRVVYSEPIWIGERVRDLAQLSDGTVVLWTDDSKLLFLTVDRVKLNQNRREDLNMTAPPQMSACINCHHFGPTNPQHQAPTLSGVLGRTVASDAFLQYSSALKMLGGVWTRDRLKAFIADPNRYAPGARMPGFALSEEDLDQIVDVLAQQTSAPNDGSPSSRH